MIGSGSKAEQNNAGFTIVELIVIIIVIAILAALTIVSYNVVTQNVREQAVRGDLQKAITALNRFKADNGVYPSVFSQLNFQPGEDMSYQYSYKSTDDSFCITASGIGADLFAKNGSRETTSGGCPGHGVGGQAAITNVVRNPNGAGAVASYANSGWFSSICAANTTDTPGVSWNGKTWHRLTYSGTGCNTFRMMLNLSDLQDGQTYRVSALVGNSGTSSMTFSMDLADQGNPSFNIAAGSEQTVSFTASRATYDNTFRFVDLNPGSGSSGILVTNVMVTASANSRNYADGSSQNWVWNGAPNASTSTGPAL